MKIVFFSPHSALWVHTFPEALVAEALEQAGHEIVYVTCGRLFETHCVCMSAHGLTTGSAAGLRDKVCVECETNARLVRQQFGYHGYDLAQVVSDRERAEAGRLVQGVTPETLLSFEVDGVEVGRASLSTFLLTHKRGSLEFTAGEWQMLLVELRNTLLSFRGAATVLEREKPDRVILYSSGYSVNLVWCLLAQARGVPFYYMNAGSNLSDRLQKVVLSRGHSLQRRLLAHWDMFRSIPCPPRISAYVADHLLEVLRGRSSFVYSSPKSSASVDIRAMFAIATGQQILVATMSSYDELFAAQVTGLFPSDFPLLFPQQVDWMRAVIEWVERRPELFLIIRVHPREFPNKRDPVKSDHARQLESAFARLPANVRVNWPSDNVSLYDLAEVTDVCLNAWSSVGKEMSLLGVPVVIYSPDLVFYPPDLNLVGTTEAAYFEQIDRALREGWSLERCRRAFRWQALEDCYSRIDISDSYAYREHRQRGLLERALGRAQRALNPRHQQLSDCRRRATRLGSAKLIDGIVTDSRDSVLDVLDMSAIEKVSEAQETAGLRAQLQRIAMALKCGRAAPDDGRSLVQRLLAA